MSEGKKPVELSRDEFGDNEFNKPPIFKVCESTIDTIKNILLDRGWIEFDRNVHDKWNLFWKASRFSKADYKRLQQRIQNTDQKINHWKGTIHITRKDTLCRIIRRMRANYGSLYDFTPDTFLLPRDYALFSEEFKKEQAKSGGNPWICKPVASSQGKNIFIIEKLEQLLYDEAYIIQRYITDPFLIYGYKFDLRLYVCVESFRPLSIYIYQQGLVRLSTAKYDTSNFQNLYCHLTNSSINKFSPTYEAQKEYGAGCKWTLAHFFDFLRANHIDADQLWERTQDIVILTILPLVTEVQPDRFCFEMFGFDILIQANHKPWLLEVNAAPAIAISCEEDRVVKTPLLNDLIELAGFTKAKYPPDEMKKLAEELRKNPRRRKPSPSPSESIHNRIKRSGSVSRPATGRPSVDRTPSFEGHRRTQTLGGSGKIPARPLLANSPDSKVAKIPRRTLLQGTASTNAKMRSKSAAPRRASSRAPSPPGGRKVAASGSHYDLNAKRGRNLVEENKTLVNYPPYEWKPDYVGDWKRIFPFNDATRQAADSINPERMANPDSAEAMTKFKYVVCKEMKKRNKQREKVWSERAKNLAEQKAKTESDGQDDLKAKEQQMDEQMKAAQERAREMEEEAERNDAGSEDEEVGALPVHEYEKSQLDLVDDDDELSVHPSQREVDADEKHSQVMQSQVSTHEQEPDGESGDVQAGEVGEPEPQPQAA